MDQDQLLPRDAWLASLPRSYTAAGTLLTDEAGRILVLKPNYRPGWQFAGGTIDLGEDALECARRELLEETGLDREIGRLLVVSWTHPSEALDHPAVHFVFDAGTVPVGTRIALQEAELEEYRWVTEEEAYQLLGEARGPRLRAALAARADGVVRVVAGTVTGI
ncbi:ADP-ribose pyrophosphatase [Streptomyces tateyamensis]|uniref:ADP-ribose pyrophosphatase n=1 Tax=Streptomyces tateyamensis TaxID=565073 RepID=A0A2V4MWN3_9ACTN|nr:NUDIX hydrolase [Streptomyces tateyamensis]PYC73559.1 ADP-ribose pyrophosphatase [Streptomyces tateyamensis]